VERFTSFDGLTLAYSDEGDGQPVLLLHGFGSSTEDNWRRPGVVSALVTAGHRVLGLDARGHGESEKPHQPYRYGDGAMRKDAQALLDLFGLGAVDVVGYSMGAETGLGLAGLDRRVRRLVLGGFGLEMAGRVGGAIEPEWKERSRRIAEALEAVDPALVTDDTARSYRRFADAHGADRHALAAIQRADRFGTSPVVPGMVRTPTLVINGDRDVSPYEMAAQFPLGAAALVKGSHLSAVNSPAFVDSLVQFLAD
jgi:pimeloyl-ACP methyl ester carboxylesterase